MRPLLLFMALVCSLHSIAQGGKQAYVATVTGTIYVPTLQSINVQLLQDDAIQFTRAEEFDNGKLLPNFLKATVISNVPYLISVMASSDHLFTASSENSSIPVSIIRLRDNITNEFVSVASFSKPLLMNKNANIKAEYLVDASFNPGWSSSGGQYNTTLIFTLTPQ